MLNEAVSKTYMIAGYAVIISVILIYVISLVVRWRNLKRDMMLIEESRQNQK